MYGFWRLFCCCFGVNLNKAKKRARASRPVTTYYETKVNVGPPAVSRLPGHMRRLSTRPAQPIPEEEEECYSECYSEYSYGTDYPQARPEPAHLRQEISPPLYHPRPDLQPKKPVIRLAQQPLRLASETLGQAGSGRFHLSPIQERRTDSGSGSSNDVFYPARDW